MWRGAERAISWNIMSTSGRLQRSSGATHQVALTAVCRRTSHVFAISASTNSIDAQSSGIGRVRSETEIKQMLKYDTL